MAARARYGVESEWAEQPDKTEKIFWIVRDRIHDQIVHQVDSRKLARALAAELNQRVTLSAYVMPRRFETAVEITVIGAARGFWSNGVTLADNEARIPWTSIMPATVREGSRRLYPHAPFRVSGIGWSGTVFVVGPYQRRVIEAARSGTLRVDLHRLPRKK